MSTRINGLILHILIILVLLFSFLRVFLSLKPNSFTDFYCHFDFTLAVLRNLDPYCLENMVLRKWDDLLIIFPGITFFYFPLIFFGTYVSKFIDLGINFSLSAYVFYLFFAKTAILGEINFRRPTLNMLFFVLLGAIYLNSSPIMMTFRHGQITVFCTFFLLLTIFSKNKLCQVIFFGLTAGYKYSMLTLFAPAFFLKKNYLVSILAFIIFLMIAIFPLYLGNDIIFIYKRYFEVLREDLHSGFNNYATSGYNMLQFEFFRCNYINTIGKIVILLTAAYIMFRERKTTTLGLNYLFTLSCLTMLISYHRLYDLSLVVLLLYGFVALLLSTRQWIKAGLAVAFSLYFIVPFSLICSISEALAEIPGIGEIVYISKYYKIDVFPFSAVMFLLLTVYSLYLYFFNKFDITLTPGKSENYDKKNR